MSRPLCGLVALLFLSATASAQDAAANLHTLIDDEWDYLMHEYPTFATYTGYPGQNDRWTDMSLEAHAQRDEHMRDLLDRINAIPRAELEPADQLNYDLIQRQAAFNVESIQFPDEYLQIDQLNGVQIDMPDTIGNMPAANVADFENIIARLDGAGTYVRQIIELLKLGSKKGITPPQITLRDVPDQVDRILAEPTEDHPLMEKFKTFPSSIPAAEQERLRSAARTAITENVIPAYKELKTFLTNEYIPNARIDIAFSSLPNGEAWYAQRIRGNTTTDMTADEIHELGLSEVERIRTEMEAVVKETGFEGDLMAFFDFVRSDPQFFYTDKEELLRGYRDICKRADPELIKLFGKLPRTPYGVKAIPAYVEQSHATAYYQPGAAEAGRPGYFCANTYALDTRPKWEMEALALHESVPGHHLQISIAQEMTGVPEFRKWDHYTAYIEGWGLYAESLGTEMGFYTDPYYHFGQLTYEMWRAIRLVVDTGMHAKGWSRQQAIDYFMDNAGKAEHDITVEIDRYIVWPGQALAYKIGELKIKELRTKAQAELGDQFDIRAFHDAVLANGALPLDILDTQINAWITQQKKP